MKPQITCNHNWRQSFSHPIIFLVLLASGCASLPKFQEVSDNTSTSAPRFATARGVLSQKQSQAILEKLKRESGSDGDILQRHIALEQAIVGTPLVTGNKLTLLRDGPATYAAMFGAIRNAKTSINLETYIFDDDAVGEKLSDLLLTKQAQGVQVNIIYDGVGAFSTPKDFFKRLRDGGIRTLEFNPVNPLSARKGWQVNNRDHRKLLVVDGNIAFTGGINISAVYSSSPSGHLGSGPTFGAGKKDAKHTPWRDTQIQIEGPVVAEFQKLFFETWNKQKGEAFDTAAYFPALTAKGSHLVRAIGSSYDSPYSLMYITILSAIRNAEKAVHITNAYFVPDPQLVEMLGQAAGRGVDVKLILPSYSDSWLVFNAGRSHYEDLLEAGVKIYERNGALLHAKTAVIDGVWSTVGSTNLDKRSFLHNDEINAVILAPDFAEQMETMFEADLQQSNEITKQSWAKRPFGTRSKEWAARIWDYWL